MKRLIQLLVLSLVTILGSSAATTVAQRLLRADGQPYTGRFRISWPTYLNASNQIVRSGYTTVVLESDGDFSVALAPHIASPASGPIYTVDYNELRQGTRQTEYWDVPDTVSTLAIAAVVTKQPSAAPIGITSLPNLITVGTLTTGMWHASTITVPYGGTGATTLTGVLKGNGTSPFTVVSGTATDCVLVNGSSGSCGGTGISDGDKGDITISSSGAVWTVDNLSISNAKVATAIDAVKLADGSVSNTELQYLDGASSNLQTQLGGKVVGPASATNNCAPVYDGTTGKLLKDSPICYDTATNGTLYQQGVTSGGLALSVANIAGTAVTLIWPTDSNAAVDGAALTMGAAATCPTLLPAGVPTTCRYMTWTTPSGGSGGTAVAPYSTTVSAQTSVSISAATHGQGTLAVPECFDGSTPRLAVGCSFTRNTSGDLVFTFLPAFTGQIQIGSGGGTSITPYTSSPSAQTSVSISAATHGKGATPRVDCFNNASPARLVACDVTRNGSGDLVFTFLPAFTGTIEIRF